MSRCGDILTIPEVSKEVNKPFGEGQTPSIPVGSSSANTTTKLSIARLKGLTLELLEMLHDEPITIPEIASLLGRNPHHVRVYIYNMRNRGLCQKSDFGAWCLTERGESIHT